MGRIKIVRRPDRVERTAIAALLDRAAQRSGLRPLSDHLWLDLHDNHSATYVGALDFDNGAPQGYVQLLAGATTWSMGAVIDPQLSDAEVSALLTSAVEHVGRSGGGTINWWIVQPDDPAERFATGAGFSAQRELHQMRVPLPLDVTSDIVTRSFVPGEDEAAWLRVNNEAFAGHAEQGGWDAAKLAQREREPWFDPDGFLLHERDGALAAFCWTKVHASTMPPMGEIYVIAVDPRFHGLGLGPKMTIAGLAHLAGAGLRTGMLYVDADNTTALGMYQRLGFTVHHTDRAYAIEVADERRRSR